MTTSIRNLHPVEDPLTFALALIASISAVLALGYFVHDGSPPGVVPVIEGPRAVDVRTLLARYCVTTAPAAAAGSIVSVTASCSPSSSEGAESLGVKRSEFVVQALETRQLP
jgi:hypothetical protein